MREYARRFQEQGGVFEPAPEFVHRREQERMHEQEQQETTPEPEPAAPDDPAPILRAEERRLLAAVAEGYATNDSLADFLGWSAANRASRVASTLSRRGLLLAGQEGGNGNYRRWDLTPAGRAALAAEESPAMHPGASSLRPRRSMREPAATSSPDPTVSDSGDETRAPARRRVRFALALGRLRMRLTWEGR